MYIHPEYLMSIDELSGQLNDPNLRIFDTAVHLTPKGHGYEITTGEVDYLASHIPGAGFINLVAHWADTSSDLRFTLPTLEALQSAIGETGIGANHQVVLYSSGHLMWATRAWWLLYHAGHRNMVILNGNFTAWVSAGLPTESGQNTYPATTFTAAQAQSKFADTQAVAAGMDGKVCTINSLSKSLYEGSGDFYYERRGHIPGSLPLYYDVLLDNEHFLPADQLAAQLNTTGALDVDEVITYCGGGIAATLDAFACVLCGQESVQVYDGSMSEWVKDENRPLTEGSAP